MRLLCPAFTSSVNSCIVQTNFRTNSSEQCRNSIERSQNTFVYQDQSRNAVVGVLVTFRYAQEGSGGVALPISNLSAGWGVGGQRHPPRRLTPEKGRRCPLCKRLGGSRRRSGRAWSRENLLSARRFELGTTEAVVTALYGSIFILTP